MSDLMTLDEVAALWKVSREHARRYIVRQPEFPDPAPGSSRKNKRWLASEVIAFLNHSEEMPA